MTAVSFRHLPRLAGVAFGLAVVACNGSELTSPSTRGAQVTAATSGNSADLLALTGHIAFVSTRAGNAEIYVMKADGTGVTRLTRNSAKDGQPAPSPNGKKIAFVSNRAGNDEIYVMNVDGTGVTRLTHNSAVDGAPPGRPTAARSPSIATGAAASRSTR